MIDNHQLFLYIKVYWHVAIAILLHMYSHVCLYPSSLSTFENNIVIPHSNKLRKKKPVVLSVFRAELSSCNKDAHIYKAKKFYCLAFYR